MNCECIYHRYHSFHLCVKCDQIFPHSQGGWDEHKLHGEIKTLPISLFHHNMTAAEFNQQWNQMIEKG